MRLGTYSQVISSRTLRSFQRRFCNDGSPCFSTLVLPFPSGRHPGRIHITRRVGEKCPFGSFRSPERALPTVTKVRLKAKWNLCRLQQQWIPVLNDPNARNLNFWLEESKRSNKFRRTYFLESLQSGGCGSCPAARGSASVLRAHSNLVSGTMGSLCFSIALPTETKVGNRTSKSQSGSSVNLSDRGPHRATRIPPAM